MSRAAKVEQVAIGPMTYAHRMLRAGETFAATRRDARILKAIGRSADAPSDSVLDQLRLQYEKATGFSADKRWKEKRLRDEIAAAGNN
jgi:hypothetical protein